MLITALPVKQQGNQSSSRIFIGTRLIESLANGFRQFNNIFLNSILDDMGSDWISAWKACDQTVLKLHRLPRSVDCEDIDRAFKLLHVTSGVLYWELRRVLNHCMDQDARFSTVASIDLLIQRVDWPDPHEHILADLSKVLLALQLDS
jgi:hypothetical protein